MLRTLRTRLLPTVVLAALLLGLLAALALAAAPVAALPQPEAAQPEVRTVQEFHRLHAAGDMQGVRALLDVEVEWHVAGKGGPAGTKRGVQPVLAYLSQMKGAGVDNAARLTGAAGSFVLDARPGEVRRGGVLQSFLWLRVYALRKGKIFEVWESASDQAAADVFFFQAFPRKPEEQLIIDFVPRPGQ